MAESTFLGIKTAVPAGDLHLWGVSFNTRRDNAISTVIAALTPIRNKAKAPSARGRLTDALSVDLLPVGIDVYGVLGWKVSKALTGPRPLGTVKH